jgi:chromosome segregation ATPase
MAAKMVSKDEVAIVVEQLESAGKVASTQSIYDVLKKGSMTTIHGYLKDLKQEKILETQLEIPERVKILFDVNNKKVWKEIWETMSLDIVAVKEKAETEIQQANTSVESAHTEIDTLRQKLDESEQRCRTEQKLRHEGERRFEKIKADDDARNAQLTSWLQSGQQKMDDAIERQTTLSLKLDSANANSDKHEKESSARQVRINQLESRVENVQLEKIESEARLQARLEILLEQNEKRGYS